MAPISCMSSSNRMGLQDLSDLPIHQRGLFLSDNFFRDSREHFHQALDKVLSDWEDQDLSDWKSSTCSNWDQDMFSDRLKRYRNLKKDHIKTDSQAVTEISDEHQHKIVIDVREFMHGNLNISIVGDHELLVKGSIEETASHVIGKKSFEKKFSLPSEAIISESTSAMSSDGILTIIIPKEVIEVDSKENKKEDLLRCQMDQKRETVSNQKHSLFADNFMDEFLPISRRGHFFSDSVFKDAHHGYNKAVQAVLDRWNENNKDEFSSYRNMRQKSLKEENQAVTEYDTEQEYKIIIDVADFVTDGEINVKVVNNKYLEVEGSIDKEQEQTISKQNFRRKFTLPSNTDIQNISSLLSSDGVLTITAPKHIEQIKKNERIIPVKHETSMKKECSESNLDIGKNISSAKSEKKMNSAEAKECITNIKYNSHSENSKNHNIENTTPLTILVNDKSNKMESNQNTLNENRMDKSNLPYMQQTLNSITEESDRSSETESELSETGSNNSSSSSSHQKASGREYVIPMKVETDDKDLEINLNKSREIKVENQTTKQGVEECKKIENADNENSAFNKVPIVKRGPFFIDSFFNESQKNFEKAVQNILQQSGFSSKKNDLQFYRNLRERGNSEKHQANDCTEDDKSFKIVIDVKDYKNDEITIKVYNAYELTVEGEQNQCHNHTILKRRFCRKFVFPSDIICEEVTSAVSEDGVLTINAPKKVKESLESAVSNEAVKSFLIADESNNRKGNSNENILKSEYEDMHNKSVSNNNEFVKCVDECEQGVEEEGQTLPITRRGSFFTDPYFEDSRLIFKNAISNFIDKSGFIAKDDDFSFYKSMIERKSDKQDLASTITESDNIYKIVLDIHGFSAEEIKTQFTSSTDLIIEATHEKEEEGSTSTRKFRRCFVFPNSVNIEAVTTSLSSDGILTISAPKKISEETKVDESCSKSNEKNISLDNGWEDEKTHQSSSERDGVQTKTFSKCKSSYQQFTKSTQDICQI